MASPLVYLSKRRIRELYAEYQVAGELHQCRVCGAIASKQREHFAIMRVACPSDWRPLKHSELSEAFKKAADDCERFLAVSKVSR